MPSLPWQTPSNEVLGVFADHISDVEALYKRPLSKGDGEWVYVMDRVARSAADYAAAVDLLCKLHWQSQDTAAVKQYLDLLRAGLVIDVATLDGAVNNSQLAVIREETRSLRNDIRSFDTFVASMIATLAAPPSPAPPQQSDFEDRRDSF
jgi:hypothetical protein